MSKIKEFIEENIELIDSNDWEKFFTLARVKLGIYTLPGLRQVFESCDINPLNHISMIPESWYAHDEHLVSIDIPEGIQEIKSNAFYNCTKLESITFPSTLRSLSYYVFENCYKLDNIDLSNFSMRQLGIRVFANCSSLRTIQLPRTIEHMGTCTFDGCMNLREITLPRTLKVIDKETFINCQLLFDINFEGTVEEWKAVRRYDRCFVGVPAKTIKCIDGITKLRPSVQWRG